ncbi:DoxX family protein [Variovorax sp. WS11]|uniref:DoxX family protein n=1 Tax=Variovorax sp. WS11 TaxID=1105204 RepID=UPI001C637068|nr:DoxX family protein [Variovorax sp. WS11]
MAIRLSPRVLFNGLLFAFFLLGGFGNVFAADQILEDYVRWGYPGWFHYVSGVLEMSTAALLLFVRTRIAGVLVGTAMMVAAAGTVLLHGEFLHAIAPVAVLILLLVNGWLAMRP